MGPPGKASAASAGAPLGARGGVEQGSRRGKPSVAQAKHHAGQRLLGCERAENGQFEHDGQRVGGSGELHAHISPPVTLLAKGNERSSDFDPLAGVGTNGALGSSPATAHPASKEPDSQPDRLAALQDSYALRTQLRRHAADKRIAVCGTRVFGDPVVVTQELGSGERRAHWKGVILCNRVGCSVCGAVRARRFGERVQRMLQAGGDWQHVIFTVPHSRRDAWGDVFERLLQGLRDLSKGTSGYVLKTVVKATARATEDTWGMRAGWHVHFHVLWQLGRPLLEAERQLLGERWAQVTGAHAEYGMRFGACFNCDQADQRAKAARYVSKLAAELSGTAKQAHPEHFSLGDIMRRAAAGDPRFVALLREYQTAAKGRRLYQLDRRARQLHDAAPELPELTVLREWHTSVDRAEFSGLSRAERYGGEPLAVFLPLEVATRTRGDPSDDVADVVGALLQAFDSPKPNAWPPCSRSKVKASAVLHVDFSKAR